MPIDSFRMARIHLGHNGPPLLHNIILDLALDKVKTMKVESMKVESMKIDLVDGPIKPLHVNTPRKTPYSYQGASKAKLDKLVSLGILELVEGSSDWILLMSFVPKPDGDVRLVADLVHLNKYVKRSIHPFQCPKDIIAQIDMKAKYFAVFDAKSGYWQIPLTQNSKQYTRWLYRMV